MNTPAIYLVAFVATFAGLAVLVFWQRRRDFLNGPNYRQHLREWEQRDPKIKPAKVPKIEKLRGEKATNWHNLRRVK
jgi:hypothetical protein